ncbi:MAG: ubiquinone-binding protein [Rhodospirillaceae bacterium]|nr:ubiquinone-binding protein [Rhodospirillaceae bacterium]
MPKHFEKRILPYSRDKIFDLIADVEKYPEFLPWCVGARVSKRERNFVYADLLVGFKWIKEVYTSKVIFNKPDIIKVEYQKGPFKYLINNWKIESINNGCEIEFFIDFEFRSKLLSGIIGPFFDEAVSSMVGAFEKRAHQMYDEDIC